MKTINLYDLPVDISYDRMPKDEINTPAGIEEIPARIMIWSVKANNIEIIDILPLDQIADMEADLMDQD